MSQPKDPTGGDEERRGAPVAKPGVIKRRPAITPHGNRAAGRHAVNTGNVYTWQNYKAWLEKVRRSWDEKK